MKTEDNRKFFRVKCKVPICTQISIVKVNNKAVTSGIGNICLEDISPGGLKFLSSLNMPVSDDMIIEFKLVVDELKSFYGYILRKEELGNSIYRYGVKFINEGVENEKAVRKLYELTKRGIPSRQKFCYGNIFLCLKQYKGSKLGNLNKKCKFNERLKVEMCMHTNKDETGDSQYENILINNISSEGIEFTCDKIITELNSDYDFKINIMGKEIFAKGNVVKAYTFSQGLYGYSVKFNISNSQKKLISELLKDELEFFLPKRIHGQRCFIDKYNSSQWKDKNFEWWV